MGETEPVQPQMYEHSKNGNTPNASSELYTRFNIVFGACDIPQTVQDMHGHCPLPLH